MTALRLPFRNRTCSAGLLTRESLQEGHKVRQVLLCKLQLLPVRHHWVETLDYVSLGVYHRLDEVKLWPVKPLGPGTVWSAAGDCREIRAYIATYALDGVATNAADAGEEFFAPGAVTLLEGDFRQRAGTWGWRRSHTRGTGQHRTCSCAGRWRWRASSARHGEHRQGYNTKGQRQVCLHKGQAPQK